MDLQQLRVFVAVAQKGNLTRASEALYLSQSAVSAQIKALETELGLKLFDRSARGMALTPAGTALLEEAERALQAAKSVIARARHLRDGDIHGQWKIGTITEPVILRLGEFLSQLQSHYPNLRVSLSQGISGDVIERVINGELDAGYTIGEIHDSRLCVMPVMPITLRIAGPAAWSEKIAAADWAAIAAMPWISTPERCSFSSIAVQMFRRHSVTPRAVIEADQETMLKKLVASGIGLTLLREDIARASEAAGELAVWRGCAEVTSLNFIYASAREETPALQAIVEVVKEVWRLTPQPPST